MVDWATWEEAGLIVDTIGGLLFIFLGIVVSRMPMQSAQQKWFIGFSLTFGLFYTLNNIRAYAGGDTNDALVPIEFSARALTLVMSVGLGIALVSRRRAARAWPAMVLATSVFALHSIGPTVVRLEGLVAPYVWFDEITYAMSYAGLTWLVLVQAWATRVQRIGLIAMAMVPFVSVNAGVRSILLIIHGQARFIADTSGAHGPWLQWVHGSTFFVMVGAIMLVWGTRMAIQKHPNPWPRRILLGTALGAIFGTLWAIWTIEGNPANLGIMGLTRGVGVALLAYGIGRNQSIDLGLQAKVGVRTTLQALIVTAFVVTAAMVLNQFISNAAAVAVASVVGLLVAMATRLAPMQAMAERVAAKVIPNVVPLNERRLPERLLIYEELLRSSPDRSRRTLNILREHGMTALALSEKQVKFVENNLD